MEALVGAFDSIRIQEHPTLTHDVQIILECWKNKAPRLLLQNLAIQPGEFESTSQLYDDVCLCLRMYSAFLMELMPYIDDYIEYYDTMTYI